MKYSKPEALEFRQIVLEHIKKILEISSEELRNKTIIHFTGNVTNSETREDTRKSYIQAIENLSYVLLPYFDKKIKEVYNETIEIINLYNFEIKEKFPEKVKKLEKELGKGKLNNWVIKLKLSNAKKLFIALNELLHRNSYLKSSVYGDVKDEVVEDEEDNE